MSTAKSLHSELTGPSRVITNNAGAAFGATVLDPEALDSGLTDKHQYDKRRHDPIS
ncbi:MAG: hypothetical protein KDB86_08445 [Actinobacteria bacterium]|nr:hypothetical protein [Actinomycetota bacterium]